MEEERDHGAYFPKDVQLIASEKSSENLMGIDAENENGLRIKAQEVEQGEGDDSEEDGDDEFALTFEGDMNPFDYTEKDASGVQPFEKFERLEYESLAEKKRKLLLNDQNKEVKLSDKPSQGSDLFGASIDEIMEAMNYGGGNRRKRKKMKKRGRPRGSRNKLSPEVTKMLGEGTLHYACGRCMEAISVLNEVVRIAPNLPDTYHTLGLVYDALGNEQKATSFYMLAAVMRPKDSSLWKLLLSWSLEQRNVAQARYCLTKAVMADPEDATLKFHLAWMYIELGEIEKAVKTYEQIANSSPDNVEAFKSAAKLHKVCGLIERAVGILVEYLEKHPSGADLTIVNLLAAICMESGEYGNALKHIEVAQSVYCSETGLPFHLVAKAGICHLFLGNMGEAKNNFGAFTPENACDHADLIIEIADAFKSLEQYESAKNYYLMLENNSGFENENLCLNIAQCYLSLGEKESAIKFFYKALKLLEHDVDTRLNLASLLLEQGKEHEAIVLLSPTNAELALDSNCDQSKQWWHNDKVKLKLANIYRARMMQEEFVNIIYPLVHLSLTIQSNGRDFRPRKKLSTSVLLERTKVLDDQPTENVFQGFRPVASAAELSKATRAKRMLQKKSAKKEEMKAKALTDDLGFQSEDSDDEPPRQPLQKPPIPELLKDEEHHQLILDLCKALGTLQRYQEALDITQLTLKLASNDISVERKNELMILGVEMACNVLDAKHGYPFIRDIVQLLPNSIAAWNCYYKVISKMEYSHSRHSRFLHKVRDKDKDCVPPILISGHQFTGINQHQVGAREYLEAYKILPNNPLINLCVGTALINLSFDVRLQNKHQCLTQGLAFLYKNLQLCGDTQETLYNIARAYHHVGLVTLAGSYYEKVLAIQQKDCPLPKFCYETRDLNQNLKPGYCNLRREAAYNLHLIYKRSGAFDLARQLLRDHCRM